MPWEDREGRSIAQHLVRVFSATVVVFLFAAIFVLSTWMMEGRTLADRCATTFVMPLGLLWLATLWFGVWFGLSQRWSTSLAFGFLFGLIGLTTNHYVAQWMLASIEMPESGRVQTLQALCRERPLRTVVLLGGGVAITPLGRAELNRDGDRVRFAAELWHAGLTQSIISTGATAQGDYDPSEVGRSSLISLGVPTEVIYQIGGENTTQEMVALSQWLESPPDGFPREGEVALVTSAFHMSRSMRLASRHPNLRLVPLPSGYRGTISIGFVPRLCVPTAEAADNIGFVVKESLAQLLGR